MLTRIFPILAALAAVAGYLAPGLFVGARGWIVPLLMLVMLSMGLTLTLRDFSQLTRYRGAILAGVILQFSVMPLIALSLARGFDLSTDLLVGMLLVGTVAGGTASNVMTYLAKGNVAVSVSMTALSTLLSVVLTPLLMLWLASSTVDVPASDMLQSLVMIILLPVGSGLIVNHFWSRQVRRLDPLLAPVSILVIAFIIAIVVALNADRLSHIGPALLIVPLLHNILGLTFGYFAARQLGFEAAICRTIALEVGMQNSGLATALALKFFSPMSALPGAIFSIWLNITGSIFAALSTRDKQKEPDPSANT